MDVIPGVVGTVRVQVLTVAADGLTASVNVLDNNGAKALGPATVPTGLITVTGAPVAVNDVMIQADTGNTAVVRWVDPGNGFNWSFSATGLPLESSVGWHKIGTATITGS